MVIGIPLLKGYLDDGREIFYLEENVRRKFQNMGFFIKTFIPDNDYKIDRSDFDVVNGIYLPEGDYDKSIIDDIKKIGIPIYGDKDFINKCKIRNVQSKKKDKTIGVVSKYIVTDGVSKVYLTNRLKRTLLLGGANIELIIPIQDVDYPTTRGCDYPVFTDNEKELINMIICKIDGLLLPGGLKFTPYDRYLLEMAISKDIPTLGICLGMQTISCYKDEINLIDIDSNINHNQEKDDILTHNVVIDKNSLLYKIVGNEKIMVNSFHRKTITPNKYLNSVAFCDDNIIEALEMPGKRFVLGVQWHPEISYEFDYNSKKIIDYYIDLL